MSDSLELFLQDLRFDVPPGLVERAKAAAVAGAKPRAAVYRNVSTRPGADGSPSGDRRGTMGRRTEFAAAIAAIVLAAIVVGSFVYVRSLTRPHNVTPPITSPSPGVSRPSPALTQSLNVPNTTPVILFDDAGNPNQIDGMTWDGRAGKVTEIAASGQPDCQTTGTTQVCSPTPFGGGAPPLTGAISSSPKGTLFVAIPYFYDRSGHVVAELPGALYAPDTGVGLYFVGTWADDELHYCQVLPVFGGTTAVNGTLKLTTPGGTPRDVARIGTQGASENTLNVTACSVQADRAVVVQANPSSGSGGNTIAQYWVVQLSDGHVLWTRDVRGGGVASVVASPDGRYIAEVQSTGSTTIYGPSGTAAGHVDGLVEAFSWDGSLGLVVRGGGASVLRWRDGTIVWNVPSGEGLAGFQPEPGGTSFAVRTENGALYVVSSDGRVIAQRLVPGLLGCMPAQCASIPPSAQTQQMLPRVMVGDVGWSDALQRTTDGGLHWQDASPPAPTNPAKGGYSNFLLDPEHAWATQAVNAVAGQPDATALAIFGTADGGRTWSQASVPLSGAVVESARLGFLDAQHGWLVTDSGSNAFDKVSNSLVAQPITRAVYATGDGGRTWTLLTTSREGDRSTLGTLALNCSMNGLAFASLNDGWLTWDSGCGVGTAGPPSTAPIQPQVAATHDGGRTWQPVVLPSVGPASDYICTPQAPVFASSRGVLPVDCGGISTPGVSGVYATADGGRSWTFRKMPFFSQLVDFVDASRGWTFGGAGADLYRTTDGGTRWVLVKQFVGESNANGVSFVSPTVGFAITVRYSADRSSGYSTMWKTTDGGSTWSVMSTVPTGGCC